MNDDFGDRMKMYERQEAGRRFTPLLPIIARLDGKCFSGLTKGLNRPFDENFSMYMRHVTRRLVEETNASIGYTQSDEISLAYYSDDIKSQIFFDGKIQKMVSVLSSIATAHFNSHWSGNVSSKGLAYFDCRVWQLPNKVEATNAILWREHDAVKNSVSMAAHSVYSHNQLHLKKSSEMQDMLHAKGINWNDYPSHFKRGTYFQRRKRLVKFSTDELERLPAKHEARLNPDLEIERSQVIELDMPIFSKVSNRAEVIFDGADAVLADREVAL